MATHHLAQCNIGRALGPVDSPVLAGFVAALEPINQIADQAPGFVWRLQTDDGDATSIRVFDDDLLLINMSVWESIDTLAEFVYRSAHRDVMRGRNQWFEKMAEAYLVLWWIPAGTIPTTSDAKARLDVLRANGPSPEAFTFRSPFPAPDASLPRQSRRGRVVLPHLSRASLRCCPASTEPGPQSAGGTRQDVARAVSGSEAVVSSASCTSAA